MEIVGYVLFAIVIFGAGVTAGYVLCAQHLEEGTPSASHNRQSAPCCPSCGGDPGNDMGACKSCGSNAC